MSLDIQRNNHILQMLKRLKDTLENERKRYIDKVSLLVMTWEQVVASPLQQKPLAAMCVAEKMYKDTLSIMLQGDWPKMPPASKTHLSQMLLRFRNDLRECIPWLEIRVQKLIELVNVPWHSRSLDMIMHRDPCVPTLEQIVEFCISERGLLVVTRLMMLCSNHLEKMAVRLAQACHEALTSPQAHQLTELFTTPENHFILDTYLCLLYKYKKMNSIIQACKSYSIKEGSFIVKRLQWRFKGDHNVWKFSKQVAKVVVQFFVTKSMKSRGALNMNYVDQLIRLWFGLIRSLDPNAHVETEVRKIIQPAETSQHIYLMADALLTVEDSQNYFPIVMELYIRAMTADINYMEDIKLKNDPAEIASYEKYLAEKFLDLADLVKDHGVRREFVLTAFSIHPSADIFQRVEEEAIASGKTSPHSTPSQESLEPGGLSDPSLSNLSSEDVKSVNNDSQDSGAFVEEIANRCSLHLPHDGIGPEGDLCSQCGDFTGIQGRRSPNTQTKKERSLDALILIKGNTVTESLNYDVLSAPSQVLEAEKLGLSHQVCADLATLLGSNRYHLLTWVLEWGELSSRCKRYMSEADTIKSGNKELKFLDIDYNLYKDWPGNEDEYDCIEKGYEHWLENESDIDSHTRGSISEESDDLIKEAIRRSQKHTGRYAESSSESETSKTKGKGRRKKQKGKKKLKHLSDSESVSDSLGSDGQSQKRKTNNRTKTKEALKRLSNVRILEENKATNSSAVSGEIALRLSQGTPVPSNPVVLKTLRAFRPKNPHKDKPSLLRQCLQAKLDTKRFDSTDNNFKNDLDMETETMTYIMNRIKNELVSVSNIVNVPNIATVNVVHTQETRGDGPEKQGSQESAEQQITSTTTTTSVSRILPSTQNEPSVVNHSDLPPVSRGMTVYTRPNMANTHGTSFLRSPAPGEQAAQGVRIPGANTKVATQRGVRPSAPLSSSTSSTGILVRSESRSSAPINPSKNAKPPSVVNVRCSLESMGQTSSTPNIRPEATPNPARGITRVPYGNVFVAAAPLLSRGTPGTRTVQSIRLATTSKASSSAPTLLKPTDSHSSTTVAFTGNSGATGSSTLAPAPSHDTSPMVTPYTLVPLSVASTNTTQRNYPSAPVLVSTTQALFRNTTSPITTTATGNMIRLTTSSIINRTVATVLNSQSRIRPLVTSSGVVVTQANPVSTNQYINQTILRPDILSQGNGDELSNQGTVASPLIVSQMNNNLGGESVVCEPVGTSDGSVMFIGKSKSASQNDATAIRLPIMTRVGKMAMLLQNSDDSRPLVAIKRKAEEEKPPKRFNSELSNGEPQETTIVADSEHIQTAQQPVTPLCQFVLISEQSPTLPKFNQAFRKSYIKKPPPLKSEETNENGGPVTTSVLSNMTQGDKSDKVSAQVKIEKEKLDNEKVQIIDSPLASSSFSTQSNKVASRSSVVQQYLRKQNSLQNTQLQSLHSGQLQSLQTVQTVPAIQTVQRTHISTSVQVPPTVHSSSLNTTGNSQSLVTTSTTTVTSNTPSPMVASAEAPSVVPVSLPSRTVKPDVVTTPAVIYATTSGPQRQIVIQGAVRGGVNPTTLSQVGSVMYTQGVQRDTQTLLLAAMPTASRGTVASQQVTQLVRLPSWKVAHPANSTATGSGPSRIVQWRPHNLVLQSPQELVPTGSGQSVLLQQLTSLPTIRPVAVNAVSVKSSTIQVKEEPNKLCAVSLEQSGNNSEEANHENVALMKDIKEFECVFEETKLKFEKNKQGTGNLTEAEVTRNKEDGQPTGSSQPKGAVQSGLIWNKPTLAGADTTKVTKRLLFAPGKEEEAMVKVQYVRHPLATTMIGASQVHKPLVVVTSEQQTSPIQAPTVITTQCASSPNSVIVPAFSGGSKIPPKNKSRSVKTVPNPSKSPPAAKPQQKPQEDASTTQKIFAILQEYEKLSKNSPDMNNRPAPRRRSNPPATSNPKRKKSLCKTKETFSDGDETEPLPSSEDSSSNVTMVQVCVTSSH